MNVMVTGYNRSLGLHSNICDGFITHIPKKTWTVLSVGTTTSQCGVVYVSTLTFCFSMESRMFCCLCILQFKLVIYFERYKGWVFGITVYCDSLEF